MSRTKVSLTPQLMDVFLCYGYEGANTRLLAKASGLKASGLYSHFPSGKEEMAAEALEYFSDILQKSLLEPLQSNHIPVKRLQAMNQNIYEFYRYGQQTCLLSSFTIGTASELFQERVQSAIELWIDSLEALLLTFGISGYSARHRAEEAIALIQGALVLSRGLNDETAFKRLLDRIPENLLRPE